jgi:hypothetical protein
VSAKDSISLSPTYGVNPAIPKCFFCLEDKNEIILPGWLPGDIEAPRGAVWDRRPCDKCAEYMERGVILISVRNGETGKGDNPYRTGGWAVIKEDAIRRALTDQKLAEQIIRQRVAFIEDDSWDQLGLPRPGQDEPNHV